MLAVTNHSGSQSSVGQDLPRETRAGKLPSGSRKNAIDSCHRGKLFPSGAEPRHGAFPRFFGFNLPISCRCIGDQGIEQIPGHRGNVFDRVVEGLFVRLRRLRKPAELTDELQLRRIYLSVGCERIEIEQCLDITAHQGLRLTATACRMADHRRVLSSYRIAAYAGLVDGMVLYSSLSILPIPVAAPSRLKRGAAFLPLKQISSRIGCSSKNV